MFVGAHHLAHPSDLNSPNVFLQIENFRRCFGRDPISTSQVLNLDPTSCDAPGGVFVQTIPGIISVNSTTGEGVIAPAVANFFRPNAPNYFLAQALSGGVVTPSVLDSALAASNTLRTPGRISPFGAVNAQVSDGNSEYNGFKLEMNRRFAGDFYFLASYTWSHTFDDVSGFETLLMPQDSKNFRLERGDSLSDQRHRFVFSGFFSSPSDWRKSNSSVRRILAGFTVAPIVEIGSGRPFNVVTYYDSNNDLVTQTDRPRVDAAGNLSLPSAFEAGNLGRNRGVTHHTKSVNLRVTRSFVFRDQIRLDLIGEVFNLFNRFNEASASPFLDDVAAFGERSGGKSFFSRPTSAFNPRQFQVGIRLRF